MATFNNTSAIGSRDPFEESEQQIQMQVEQYGRDWIADRERKGLNADVGGNIETTREFTEAIRAKRDQLAASENREDLIRRARGKYNPITHKYEDEDVRE